ncbi:MAG: M13 family metallopeptidase [Thalassotalea sp.]
MFQLKLKAIIATAACSSLLFIAGCADNNVQNAASSPEKVLQTGIDLTNIDPNVRPQDNFYRYVNGGWINRTAIPADKTSVGAFYDLRDEADDNVKKIIEELAARQYLVAGSDEQKVGDLYNSYMDQATRDSLGLAPIAELLAEIKTLKSKTDLMAFFAKNQAKGITTPIYLYVSVDAKDSENYAAHIWQHGLALPDRDYYFDQTERYQTIRAGYLQHIENIYSLVGLPNGKAAAQTILALETQLAQHHWTKVQTRDSVKRYNKYPVGELSQLTDAIDWSQYLALQGVSEEQAIIINQPDFIQGFGQVLTATSLEDWQSYLTFHTISTYASYLTSEIDAENFDFFAKQLDGLEQQKPQWKRAVKLVNSHLGEVIGKVYVSRHFSPEAKTRMVTLVENLRNAYGDSIDNLAWMTPATKKQAHVKLAAFTPKIGYPDKWQDYSTLNIARNTLVANVINSGLISHQKDVAKLGGPIQKWEWHMTPQTVNAYYNPTVNEIVFPAAILQPPFFNMAADDAANYGGIGAVIGHEMGHGFDDQGSKYDHQGNLKNWWTEQDLAEFTRRGKNLVTQFNQYQVFDGLNVNGELTLGENIGDLSGVTIAYKAYQASLNGKAAPVINGLTGDQRFFLGFAQIWRSKKVEKSVRNAIATDPHAPGEFRALGALSNIDAFYQAFDVKEGDAMYIAPAQRVKIW